MIVLSSSIINKKRKYLKIIKYYTVIRDMKISLRLCLALYAAFIIYSGLTFFFGPTGYRELRKIEKYKLRLENNLSSLREINEDLSAQLEGLVSDPETLELLSRELGYLREKEGVIKIYGYKPRKNHFAIGTILLGKRESKEYPRFIGILSFLGGGFTFVLSGFMKKKSYGIRKE